MQIRVCNLCKNSIDVGYRVHLTLTSANAYCDAAAVNINGMFRPLRTEYDLCPTCLERLLKEAETHEERTGI